MCSSNQRSVQKEMGNCEAADNLNHPAKSADSHLHSEGAANPDVLLFVVAFELRLPLVFHNLHLLVNQGGFLVC